uniref:Protein BCCIP homolog (Trinotate prediction) n=1 Tax=Myxobolus squamalis TaxID=59785 RepID=A0A6B2FZ95_MYXSQ
MTHFRISHLNWFKNFGNSPVSAKYMKIRRKKCESSSDTGSEENNSDSEITANFELVDPIKNHYHGIQALLSRLFVGLNLDLSTLVDQIIHQSDASSVLIQDHGEETVFGIICALSLTPSSTDTQEWKLFNQQLIDWICEKFKNHQELRSMITSKHCALLFNERFVNIPEIIGSTMCQSLKDELVSVVPYCLIFR